MNAYFINVTLDVSQALSKAALWKQVFTPSFPENYASNGQRGTSKAKTRKGQTGKKIGKTEAGRCATES